MNIWLTDWKNDEITLGRMGIVWIDRKVYGIAGWLLDICIDICMDGCGMLNDSRLRFRANKHEYSQGVSSESYIKFLAITPPLRTTTIDLFRLVT